MPETVDHRGARVRPAAGRRLPHVHARPDGGTSDNPGCFLEIVPESRIAFTSMLTGGWRPQAPWMGFTAIITMADDDAGSRYEARVMHPDAATRERHEALGFFEGWNTCITQLDAFAATLR